MTHAVMKNPIFKPFSYRNSIVLIAALAFSPLALAMEAPIIPLPAQIQEKSGEFVLSPKTIIYAESKTDQVNAELLQEAIKQHYGWKLTLSTKKPPEKLKHSAIIFSSTNSSNEPSYNKIDARQEESYSLLINPQTITLKGAPAGQFYALQSLLQLLPPSSNSASVNLPAMDIQDQPRFAYRGMHLDVGRHFFSTDFVKKLIDQMAFYKLNRFHWHLTDDQGWRIEIKKYPKLTEVGGFRKETVLSEHISPYKGDGIPYGGFYTQEQIKDVIKYATDRHVMVIPEIEMPGHALAALSAYPELACTDGPLDVGTNWGVYDDIFCPKEETFTFLENVLTEVIDLFPAPYIHIGGDEAPKVRWENSSLAQEVIKREGLKDEFELQSWFVRRMEKFINSKGKQIIGWDEILEGGLAPNATVMSWRGESGGIAAAKHGNNVIMTPMDCCYLNFNNGGPRENELFFQRYDSLPMISAYNYNPEPRELSPEEHKYILGVQGNMWTEYLKTARNVEYLMFPRLLALAEVGWSPQEKRNYLDFQQRLYPQYASLDKADIEYRIPAPIGLETDTMLVKQPNFTLNLKPSVPNGRIYYTLDGTKPTLQSTQYTQPVELTIPNDSKIQVNTIVVNEKGRESIMHTGIIRNRDFKPAFPEPSNKTAGVSFKLKEGKFGSMKELNDSPTIKEGINNKIDWEGYGLNELFGLQFDGWIYAPEDAVYQFVLNADDYAELTIDNESIIPQAGYSGPGESKVPLQKGWHKVGVNFYQLKGGVSLNAEWAKEGETLQRLDKTIVTSKK